METGGIYRAITNAMSDISPIAKEKRNKEQGFQYRGVDDVMNELSPILTKHRIFIYPEIVDSKRSERQTQKGNTLLYSILTIKYHFATEDGSEVCATVIGEGMDSGDKASNKAMAVAFKYACLQMFCIPTDDMDDPDKESPPPSSGKQETPKQTNPQQAGDERAAILKATKEILNAENPDACRYFTDAEKAQEEAIAKGAGNLQALQNQRVRLEKELEKRKAAYKPIPFGDPEFKDDIPWKEPGAVEQQPDIF